MKRLPAKLGKRIEALEAHAQRFCTDVRSRTDAKLFAIVQGHEGYDLSLMPGATLDEKVKAVIAAQEGELVVSDEARHAARKWFELQRRV